MTITQALKEKNKLVKKLITLKTRITASNSYQKDNVPAYNSKDMLTEYFEVVRKLVSLKTRITHATEPVIQTILNMGELKSSIKILQSLNVKQGVINTYNNPVEMIAVIGEKERDAIVEELEGEIEGLQEELDKFNATTDI